MKQINIRESLVKMDVATNGRYDLTTMYESVRLSEADKKELVQYIDAYDIDATNNFLGNKSGVMGEAVADDISDEELAECQSALTEAELHFQDNRQQSIMSGDPIDDPGFDEFDIDDDDYNDGEVTSGGHFFADGEDWHWVKRVGESVHLDFDDWAVWMAFTPVDPDNVGGPNKVAFFIVDEPTGFIDWGPCDTVEEAQEFLDSKVNDWEMDESLKEGANADCIDLEELISGYELDADAVDTVSFWVDNVCACGTPKALANMFKQFKAKRDDIPFEACYAIEDAFSLRAQDLEAMNEGMEELEEGIWDDIKKVGKAVGNEIKNSGIYKSTVGAVMNSKPMQNIKAAVKDTDTYKRYNEKNVVAEFKAKLKAAKNIEDIVDIEDEFKQAKANKQVITHNDVVSIQRAIYDRKKKFGSKKSSGSYSTTTTDARTGEKRTVTKNASVDIQNAIRTARNQSMLNDCAKRLTQAVNDGKITNPKIIKFLKKSMADRAKQIAEADATNNEWGKSRTGSKSVGNKKSRERMNESYKALSNMFQMINEAFDAQKIATDSKGNYLVKADSGKGYSVFSRDNVALGGYDADTSDETKKKEIINKFNKGIYEAVLNEGPGAGYNVSGTLNIDRIDGAEVLEISTTEEFDSYTEYKVIIDGKSSSFGEVNDLSASSYYYGDDFGDGHLARVRKLVAAVYVNQGVDTRYLADMIKDALVEAGTISLKFDTLIGAGWSHTTYDGTIMTLDDIAKDSDVIYGDGIEIEVFQAEAVLTDEDLIMDIDDAVTGANEMDDEFDESLQERNLTRAERHNRNMDRIFDNKKQTDKRMMKFLKDNSDMTDEEIQKAYDDDKLGLVIKELGLHSKFWSTNESLNEDSHPTSFVLKFDNLNGSNEGYFKFPDGFDESDKWFTSDATNAETFMSVNYARYCWNEYIVGLNLLADNSDWTFETSLKKVSNGYILQFDGAGDGVEYFALPYFFEDYDAWFTHDRASAETFYSREDAKSAWDEYIVGMDMLGDPAEWTFDDVITPINESESIEESLNESSNYVEVDTISDGSNEYRVIGGGFNSRDALVSVENVETEERMRISTGDVYEFYTWYDRKGNVIREPEFEGEDLEEGANNMSKKLTEGFDTEDRIAALAEYLGIDPSEIEEDYQYYAFETPEGDYLVVDEDEAYDLAKEDIENLFDELGLDSFTPSFRDWIIMNALDNDWFEDAVRESYESYAEDIEYENSDVGFDNRLIEEMYDNGNLDDDDFVADENGDPDYSQLSDECDFDSAREAFIDDLVYNAGHAVDYCGDNFGWDWVTEMATAHGLIDMEAVVGECIDQDGIAHFIARYDGDEHDLGNGLFAYRYN